MTTAPDNGAPSPAPAQMRPVLLTDAELASLRALLEQSCNFTTGNIAQATTARHLLGVIEDRAPSEPAYEFFLAGPWGTIREGSGTEAETIAGCRDARAQHWASGQPRDDRYHSIQVLRMPTYYFTDTAGDDLGRYVGVDTVVDVPDADLTQTEQAENDRRLAAKHADRAALYAHLNAKTHQDPR